MKIEAIAVKEGSKPFRVVNGKMFRDECDKLAPGRYRLTVEKMRRKKSMEQLGYLFGCVYPLFMRLANDAGWEFTSVDEVDLFCKSLFANRPIVNRHTGETVNVPELKRNFLTTDMNAYVNKVREYAAEYLGGYIPEPGEQTKIEYQ